MANFENIVSSYFTFFYKFDDNQLNVANIIHNVKSVTFTSNGEFDTLTFENEEGLEETLSSDQYLYTNLILNIPGIGYAYSGDTVVLEQFRKSPTQFQLCFGWHENVSNQKIFSWYLKPNENSDVDYIKTLYFEDLTNIIGIIHNTTGNLIIDENHIPPVVFTDEIIKVIGVLYKDFTINYDNSCTITDLNDVKHVLTPTYTDGKITSLLYDGCDVVLEFDSSGNIVNIGGTTYDISNYTGGNI